MAVFPDIANPQFTSSGVPFEFVFEDYQEQFLERASNSFLKARVAWSDAADFLKDILGSTTGTPGLGNTMYQRTLPLEHPTITDQWCIDAKLLAYPSSSLANANQPDAIGDGGFTTDWAVYGLTFARRPYFVVSDANVSPQTIPELFRYCTIAERPRAREFTINSYSLKVEGEDVFLNVPAFVMDREQDLIITQYQIPAGLYPYTAVENCLGRINLSAVELPISWAGGNSFVTRTYAAQTLLCRGVATDIIQYPGPLGGSDTPVWYRDLPLVFTYRPNGWRKLPRPDGDGSYVTVVRNGITDVNNKYLYTTQAFAAMFKPI